MAIVLKYFRGFEKYLFVSLGAIPGALLRWSVHQDLVANIFGTFILGFIVGFECRYRYKLILAVGFCGSCTTFSSWIINVIQFIVEGNYVQAIYSLCITLILGFLSLLIAFYIGRIAKRIIVPE